MDAVLQDLRYAIRALRATPVATTIAIASLALGIGANTALFSLLDGLLLKPLPVSEPDRLIAIADSSDDAHITHAVWTRIRDERVVGDAFAWTTDRINVAPSGEAVFLDALWASGRVFDILGVRPIVGRGFSEADDRAGGGSIGPVAVISYGLWQRSFGAASSAIGRTLTIERVPFTIVGVMPPSFFGLDVGSKFDVLLPLEAEPLLGRTPPRLNSWWLTVMARLPDGASVDAATAALRAAQPAIRQATMPPYTRSEDRDAYLRTPWTARLATTGSSGLRSRYAPALVTLLGIVGCVLLVACANIATLQLARVSARAHEISVRVALGAARRRIVSQLLLESLLLSICGAVLGMVLARWASRLLVHTLSTWARTAFLDLSLDWRVLSATAAVTVTTAALFGAMPAFRAAQAEPAEALKRNRLDAGIRIGATGALVVAQVALSLLLVAGAGMFVRSFIALAYHDLGFDRSRLLIAIVDARRAAGPPERRIALFERLREAAAGVPGVEAAALSMATPLGSAGVRFMPDITAPETPMLAQPRRILTTPISAGWLRTYGTRLLAGRDFTADDRADSDQVVIVNAAFARTYLAGVNPIGRALVETMMTGPAAENASRQLSIVGLVEDAAFTSVRGPIEPTLYRPFAQLASRWAASYPTISISVRAATAPPASLNHALGAALVGVDPDLTVTFQTVQEQLDVYWIRERLLAMTSSFFGTLAVLLAAMGLYGVTAYTVSRRTREIGIRIALGSSGRAAVTLMLRQTIPLVAIGIGIGVAVTAWASAFIAALLYGVRPRDPAAVSGAAIVLALVAIAAAWVPARRAAGVDPMMALRAD